MSVSKTCLYGINLSNRYPQTGLERHISKHLDVFIRKSFSPGTLIQVPRPKLFLCPNVYL